MTADRLRAAASLLRERADGATPGPWRVDRIGDIISAPDADGCEWDVASVRQPCPLDSHRDRDAAYIATMSPPVALALADWLDAARSRWLFAWELGETPGLDPAALAVADAILGDRS